jgi:photosystem II stability/assembly factor-like uncharacterized protein
MRALRGLGISRGIATTAFALVASSSLAGPWTPSGPADAGHAVYTHPAVGGHALMFNSRYWFGGRTFSTRDGGNRWIASPDIVGEVLLSGTPTQAFTIGSETVLRSTDLGRSWAPFAQLPFSVSGYDKLEIHPANAAEWVAPSHKAIWHTIDGGASWRSISVPWAVRQLAVDWDARRIHVSFGPNRPVASRGIDTPGRWKIGGASATLLAAGHGVAMYQDGAGALFRSADGGATFHRVAQGLGVLDLCDLRFSTAPATRVYALECSTGRVFTSSDDGGTWMQAATLPSTHFESRLAVDAANPERLYAATSSTILRSDDGALTFHPLERSTGASGKAAVLHFDASDPTRQWLAEQDFPQLSRPPAGFARSLDGGASWTRTDGKWRLLGSSRSRTNTLFGARILEIQGDQDVGLSRDGGETWSSRLEAPDANWRFILLAHGSIPGELYIYGHVGDVPSGHTSKIYYSSNDGNSYIERTAPTIIVAFIVATHTGPSTLYAGGGGRGGPQLHRSTDGALTWQPVAFFPSPWGAYEGFEGNTMTAFAIDPTDPKRLYAGFLYLDHLMRSEDGGTTWSSATRGLGPGSITSLAVDPANTSTIYATQMGTGVFRSTDRGQSWVALDEGLHEDMAFKIQLDPFVAGRLHASTVSGLYRADLATGIPTGDPRGVEYHHAGFDHYFVTANPDEVAALDAGAFEGWRRTGEGFRVAAAENATYSPVCRYFAVGFAPRSSHFYSPYANECAILKSNAAWLYEGLAFGVALPESSSQGCGENTRPLYRFWNDGASGAPNHRYTTNHFVANAQEAQGWILEGQSTRVFACVPY